MAGAEGERVAVIGTGMVGSEFLEQIAESKRVIDAPQSAGKRKALDDLRLDFKVTALAREKTMRLSYDGIQDFQDCGEETDCTAADGVQPTDLDELTRFLNDDYNGNRVVIDCTASVEVAKEEQRRA